MKISRLFVLVLLLSACGSQSEQEADQAPTAQVKTPDKPKKAEAKAEKKTIPAPEDVAAPPEDATVTASGLAYKVINEGQGDVHPGASTVVEVHYTGWTTDGQMFDSSVLRGAPTRFPLNRVIAGWTEGVQLMAQGDKYRFWIPQDLAYKGSPGKPAGMLVFDVELLDIVMPPETPADVAAPPKDAEVTASGLATKVLQAGSGEQNPGSSSVVEVHYSGWTTDGAMFDSSVMRGQPARFGLNHVIAGWTEGLQLMVEGETRRMWIPEKLAYDGKKGKPAGMLVFDVELLRIVRL